MRSSHHEVPYQLAFDTEQQLICARGPQSVMIQLRATFGCKIVRDDIPYATLPYLRSSFLVAEAVASPESASAEYRHYRSMSMAPPEQYMQALNEFLWRLRLDPEQVLVHQKETCIQAYPQRGILNASEQGTGKTLVSMILAYMWQMRRVLVVCPKDVIPEWRMQHLRWFEPLRKEMCQQGAPEAFNVWTMDDVTLHDRALAFGILSKEEGRHMAVTNFESIAKLKEAIAMYRPDLVIVDESHNVKGPNSQQTIALTGVADAAQHVILSTGTPIGNDVGDLWSQVRMIQPGILALTYPQHMNMFAQYAVRETTKNEGRSFRTSGGLLPRKIVGCRDPAGLMRLIEGVWYRATKATCLNLPPKGEPRRIELNLDPEVRALYDRVVEEGASALGDELSLVGQLVVALRLQQIAGGHAMLYLPDVVNPIAPPTVVPMELPCVKLEWVKGWVRDHLLSDPYTRVIIWCRFNNEVRRITYALKQLMGETAVELAWGKTTSAQLIDIKESFNSRSSTGVRVIVAQIDKLHSGHNLQAGDWNIYFSPTWSYIKKSQSEDRTHRIGREGGVGYIHLVATGTIDEVVWDTLDRKHSLALRLAPHTVSGVMAVDDDEDADSVLGRYDAYCS